ncbi:YlzJ-like family protein [Paenibacillus sp. KN14-4R]|uniref:YlzJ-like family protein n=1 Tax=Paenibacillus sp. KN14-4R TaxID=3445773 RepID=UPI003FA02198
MIHFSVIPQEQIWEGFDSYQPKFSITQVAGLQMEVEPVGVGLGRIVRIYSPDPQHYLNPLYAPGTIISLHCEP